MSKESEEREEQKPRFQIVDRRVLTEEDRKGTSTDIPAATPLIQVPGQAKSPSDEERPKLEIIGGGNPNSGSAQGAASGQSIIGSSSLDEEPGQAVSAPSATIDAADATETVPANSAAAGTEQQMGDEEPMTEAEVEQMRSQLEAEQFAALEQEIGRPLTDPEKDQVRQMMEREAQSMTKLEVAPILLKTITELPRYAAVHLGLVANPYTGLIARNDAEARMAIEGFEALYETIKTRVDARTTSELERVLADLKANYARISGASLAPKGGPRIIR